MTSNALEDPLSCQPLKTIQMNASEFKHFVTNLKSTNLQQKLMPIARVCEGASTVHTNITGETLSQFVQHSNIHTARNFFNSLRRLATTESQVPSPQNISQECSRAQELKLAKARGIDSTSVEKIQAAKNSLSEPTISTVLNLGNDCVNNDNDNLDVIGSRNHNQLGSGDTLQENLLEPPLQLENNYEGLTEGQESIMVVPSNDGHANLVLSSAGSAAVNQANNIQDIQPSTAQGFDGEILSSQSSQMYLSATSGIPYSKPKSSNFAFQPSSASIHANVGSSDDDVSSESEYSTPWDLVGDVSLPISETEAVLVSEEMGLVTKDLARETELQVLEPGSEDIAQDDAESMEVVGESETTAKDMISSDDSESDKDSGPHLKGSHISLERASLVLLRRIKKSKQGEYSDDSVSSDEI